MPNRSAPVFRLLFFVLAAAVVPAHAQDAENWPDWLRQAMARETPALESTPISIADGAYRFAVAGEATAPQAFDGGWYIESDIGADSALECMLLTDDTDLATLVASLAEANIEAQRTAFDAPIGNRGIYSIDAGAIGDTPYLSLEWMYTIGEAPNALLGLTKVRAAMNEGVVQACTHNLVGYRETFRAAFEEFVRSAEVPAVASPYYEEIIVHRLGDRRIGIGKATFTLDEAGDSQILRWNSSLVPVGPDALSYDDSTQLSWSTPDGLLINAYSAAAQNGELMTNMEFGRTEDDAWAVTGTFQGKTVDAVLPAEAEPLSEIGQILAARALFAGDAGATVFPVWMAEADPTKVMDARLVRESDAGNRRARLEIGPLTMHAAFAESGMLTEGELNMGPVSLILERVWHRGSLD